MEDIFSERVHDWVLVLDGVSSDSLVRLPDDARKCLTEVLQPSPGEISSQEQLNALTGHLAHFLAEIPHVAESVETLHAGVENLDMARMDGFLRNVYATHLYLTSIGCFVEETGHATRGVMPLAFSAGRIALRSLIARLGQIRDELVDRVNPARMTTAQYVANADALVADCLDLLATGWDRHALDRQVAEGTRDAQDGLRASLDSFDEFVADMRQGATQFAEDVASRSQRPDGGDSLTDADMAALDRFFACGERFRGFLQSILEHFSDLSLKLTNRLSKANEAVARDLEALTPLWRRSVNCPGVWTSG